MKTENRASFICGGKQEELVAEAFRLCSAESIHKHNPAAPREATSGLAGDTQANISPLGHGPCFPDTNVHAPQLPSPRFKYSLS